MIERAELHRTIWRIANDLRGSVDGWDFKSYVLGFLFYRFISENLTEYMKVSQRAGILAEGGSTEEAASFDYAALHDAVAETAVVPMQDHLGLSSSGRINVPSTPGGNWTWRMESGQAGDRLAARLRALAELYGRAPASKKHG